MTTTVQRRKNLPWKYMRRIIYILAIITLLFFIGGAITWILNQLGIIQGAWTDKLFTILTGLGAATVAVLAIFGIFQFFLSLIPSEKAPESPASPTPPITVQFSLPQQTPSPSPSPDKIAPHGILGLPPPTDPRTIEQRQPLVKDIYTKLTQPGVTAIVLTGIGGVGKSTLAALVHRYAEEQHLAGSSPFAAEALWLTVSAAVTLTDLIGTLFEALGKPLPDLAGMTPQNQAAALFNALNTVDRARLVVLDQFENLLDWQTGQALADRPGIAEWLDALNSQPCGCRVLLTSRPMPQGTREYPPTYMQEYSIGGLETAEGIALLRKQGAGEGATEVELRTAVERCRGHAFALTLLASLLRKRSLTLATFLQDPAFTRLWTGNIARNLLNTIYTQQLDPLQRKLLLAFSVYRREPVALEAAQAVIDLPPEIPQAQVDSDLDTLLAQHLLQTSGEGRYQLHAIVADYAQSHFDEHNEQANRRAMQAAHASAAQYYLQQAATACPPREQRHGKSDIQPLIEAIWQYCQAGQRQEAYDLMEQEGIFDDLKRWGGNVILLELYQLLLPSATWQPERSQAADIHLCLGKIYNALGKRAEALKYYEQALGIAREVGDRGGEGTALNDLGSVYHDLGKKEEALRYYEQALIIFKEIGEHGWEGTTVNNLGLVYNALGNQSEALQYYEQALRICREMGDRSGEGTTLNNLGGVYDDLGNQSEALQYYEQALRICREMGDRGMEATTLWNIGALYFKQGHYDLALACLLLARGIFEEVQSPDRDKTQEWIDKLHEEVSEEQFAALLAEVEPQASQIVEQALREGL